MEPTHSIIEEMEQYKPVHYASNWLRLFTNLIDTVIFAFVTILFQNILDLVCVLYSVDLVRVFISQAPMDQLLAWLYNSIFVCVLFLFLEGLTKGYTLGKLITGTRAIQRDHTAITWKQAAIRSIVRMIPIEPLSAFSKNGLWHDRMSKTMVVKTRGV